MRIDGKTVVTALMVGALLVSPARADTQKGFGDAVAAQKTGVDAGSASERREASRQAKFATMMGEERRPGSRAEEARVSLRDALNAFADVSGGFDYSGRGDADYWLKTTRDFGMTAQSLGDAVRYLGRSLDGGGPLAAAIAGVGGQLRSIDWSGTGDADYWMARAKSIALRVRGAADQLREMAQACEPDNSPRVRTAVVLRGLSAVAASCDYAGRGDADYWMRSTRDFALIGRATGEGLSRLVSDSGDALTVVLRGFATQLTGLSYAGRGDANYWMARTRGVVEQLDGIASSLEDIADTL